MMNVDFAYSHSGADIGGATQSPKYERHDEI